MYNVWSKSSSNYWAEGSLRALCEGINQNWLWRNWIHSNLYTHKSRWIGRQTQSTTKNTIPRPGNDYCWREGQKKNLTWNTFEICEESGTAVGWLTTPRAWALGGNPHLVLETSLTWMSRVYNLNKVNYTSMFMKCFVSQSCVGVLWSLHRILLLCVSTTYSRTTFTQTSECLRGSALCPPPVC